MIKLNKRNSAGQTQWLKPVCNPNYLGGRDQGGAWFETSLSKMFEKPHFNQWLGVVVACLSP
jgi:hypothetical protein